MYLGQQQWGRISPAYEMEVLRRARPYTRFELGQGSPTQLNEMQRINDLTTLLERIRKQVQTTAVRLPQETVQAITGVVQRVQDEVAKPNRFPIVIGVGAAAVAAMLMFRRR